MDLVFAWRAHLEDERIQVLLVDVNFVLESVEAHLDLLMSHVRITELGDALLEQGVVQTSPLGALHELLILQKTTHA